jgi:TATA-binding protein-associated factor
LSGTPVQNRCQEIWAIFDFLMPNFLGTESKFFNYFAKPIINGQLPGASAEEVVQSHERLKLLHQQVLPFILRREKSQVLKELPEKVVTNLFCDLSREQVAIYQMINSKIPTKISQEHLRKKPKRSLVAIDDVKQKELNSVLKYIMLLRLLCTHPKLVVSSTYCREVVHDSSIAEKHLVPGTMAGMFSTSNLDRLPCSGKLLALNELLRNAGVYGRDITGADNDVSCLYVENDLNYCPDDSSFLPYDLDGEASKCSRSHKCLIFAQFSKSLDIVEKCLFAPHMPSLRYLRLDGSISLERRTEIVNQFNSDESIRVLLLTTKVGGLGLNLSAAQLVIMLESDWNPHADLQAIDRAHRIGQQGVSFLFLSMRRVYKLRNNNTTDFLQYFESILFSRHYKCIG